MTNDIEKTGDRPALTLRMNITPAIIDAGVNALCESDLSLDAKSLGQIRSAVLAVLRASIDEAERAPFGLEVENPDQASKFFGELC